MLKKLCSRRRVHVYLKCLGVFVLIVFYLTFLFRESLHAYEVNKGRNVLKEEFKQKIPRARVPKKNNNIVNNNNNNKFVQDTTIYKSTTKLYSTLNPVYEYSEELHSAIERELLTRKANLIDICTKENIIGAYPPNAWEFFISPGHNLVWCNVFKAASSTWMYYFNILGGYDIKYLQRTKMLPIELARKRFPRPKLHELIEVLPSSISFLTVREPFERLISAYRDKLEGCHNKYYKVLGKQIIKAFRKNAQQINNKNKGRHTIGPTFKEFLLFLIQSYKNGKKLDEHWAPIYNFCTPCSINYTIIAKVETFQRDSEYIIRQAGLEPLLLGKLPKNVMKKVSNQSTHSSGSLIKKYFSQIDRTLLDEILKIYRLDFELFGYNITKYYDIVQPPPSITVTTYTTSSTSSTTLKTEHLR